MIISIINSICLICSCRIRSPCDRQTGSLKTQNMKRGAGPGHINILGSHDVKAFQSFRVSMSRSSRVVSRFSSRCFGHRRVWAYVAVGFTPRRSRTPFPTMSVISAMVVCVLVPEPCWIGCSGINGCDAVRRPVKGLIPRHGVDYVTIILHKNLLEQKNDIGIYVQYDASPTLR